MLYNDAVQQRAGEQPSASAPKASQEPSRAQSAAKLKIPIPRQADRRHENGAMPGLRDGDMDAKSIHTAQQRAGEQPASAPTASQKISRAQTAALKIPTPKQANRRHGDIVATGLRDGNMGAMPIHIYGKHSPPFLPM